MCPFLSRVPDLETTAAINTTSILNPVKNIGAQSDVYFQDARFNSLLDILKDPALLPYHQSRSAGLSAAGLEMRWIPHHLHILGLIYVFHRLDHPSFHCGRS